MKRGIAVTLILVVFALCVGMADAAPQGVKGASAKAYEHASDKAVFNRVSDWFATVGKSEDEKAAIIAERDARRAAKKAEKAAKKVQKDMKAGAQDMKKKMKGMGK